MGLLLQWETDYEQLLYGSSTRAKRSRRRSGGAFLARGRRGKGGGHWLLVQNYLVLQVEFFLFFSYIYFR